MLSSMALDGTLPWWRYPGYWIHWAFCRLCRRYRRQISFLKRACLVAARRPPSRHPLSPVARARIKRALRADPASNDDCDCPSHRP